MDKSNEIELLQAQLIQERALVQDLEAGKSKMILDAIEVGGQFSDLREAVRVLKEVLQFVMLKAPGYDWNTDPLSITLMVGNAFTKSNHVLAGEPDEENDSLQAQLTQRTGQIAALQARVRELEQWVQDQSTANLETMRHTDEMQSRALEAEQQLTQRTAELERVRADNKALDEWRADVTVSLQRPGGAFFVDVPQHIKDLVKERDEYAHKTKMLCLQNGPLMIENHDMKKLIAALPKVEGAVVVSNGYVKDSTRCHALFGADEDAALYAALLQHRQGMEG